MAISESHESQTITDTDKTIVMQYSIILSICTGIKLGHLYLDCAAKVWILSQCHETIDPQR